GVAENLAWGYNPSRGESPFRGWYDDEKAMYEDAVASGDYPGLEDMTPYEMSRAYPNLYNQVGHYLNIIDPDSTTTGFAVAGNGQMIQGQVMDTPGLPLGTVNNGAGAIILDEGRKMTVQDYIADVQSRTQLDPDIQAAYDEALAQLEQAREQAQAAL